MTLHKKGQMYRIVSVDVFGISSLCVGLAIVGRGKFDIMFECE